MLFKKNTTFFLLGLFVGALISITICVPLIHNSVADTEITSTITEASREYIYDQLQTIATPLYEYVESGDVSDLEAANKSLANIAVVCMLWGDCYEYLRHDDDLSAINAAWCARFFIRVHEYIDSVITQNTALDNDTIYQLACIFSPPSPQSIVSFSSISFAHANSDLFYNNYFTVLVEYDKNQQLLPAEF